MLQETNSQQFQQINIPPPPLEPQNAQQNYIPPPPVQVPASNWVPAKKCVNTRTRPHIVVHGSSSPTPSSSPSAALAVLTPLPQQQQQPPPPAPPPPPPLPPPQPNLADIVILKITIPTSQIEMKLTRKFSKKNTIKEVIETCRTALNSQIQGCTFYLSRLGGERFDERYTIEYYGLNNLDEVSMVPIDEERVKSMLVNSDKKSSELGSRSIHQQCLISGYLYIRRGGTIRMPKRYWCVFKDDVVFYFISPKDKEPKGLIELNKGKVVFSDALMASTSLQSSQQQQQQQQQQSMPTSTPATLPSPTLSTLSSSISTTSSSSSSSSLSQSSQQQMTSSSSLNSSQGTNQPLIPEYGETSSTSSKDKKLKPVFSFKKLSANAWVDVLAESSTDAKNWFVAISTKTAVSSDNEFQTLLRSAKISGYILKKEGNTHIPNKRYAFIAGGSLYFCHTLADTVESKKFDLFSRKIVGNDKKLEITISEFGAEGTTLIFDSVETYKEWMEVLREVLPPQFVTVDGQEMDVNIQENVIKSGYLMKKKITRTFSTTKKRWIVLIGDKLYYARSPQDTRAIGFFELRHTQVNFYLLDGESGVKDPYLELVTLGGIYTLSHPESSEDEIREWGECIRAKCVGLPFNVVHTQHVDFNYNWTMMDSSSPYEVFKFEGKIGEGAYASVYRAKHIETGFELAVKILKLKESTMRSLQHEIDVLKKCRSPQIVLYFGTCFPAGELWILTEFCRCGSVKDIMKMTFETLDEGQMSYVVTETLKGLLYLHKMNIIHHDIKAGNILLTADCHVKLADFGVSQQYKTMENIQARNFIGSPLYMSPEVLRKSTYNQKTDIWSLGITVIEMAEGAPPHVGLTSFEELLRRHERAPPSFSSPGMWSEEIKDFLGKCLVMDVVERSSPVDLLMHPFLRHGYGPEVLKSLVDQCIRIQDSSKQK